MELSRMEIVAPMYMVTYTIEQVISEHPQIKDWAYILHDKCQSPHYHIYLNCYQDLVDESEVAKWFQLVGYVSPFGTKLLAEDYIFPVISSEVFVLLHMLHHRSLDELKTNIDLYKRHPEVFRKQVCL